MKLTLKTLLASATLLAVASPSLAQNVALVIGNSDYANAGDLSGRDHDRLVDAYAEAGFDVTQGENLTRTQLFTLLGDFIDEVEGAERVVVHLSGHTVTTSNENWFMPVDTNGDSVVRIGLTAPTLDLFLSMVDDAQELGVLFVGTDESGGFTGEGYETGVGRLYAPRDTMAVVGPIAAISTLVRNEALQPGMALREVGSDLPDGVRRFGVTPRDAVLVEEQVAPAPLPVATPAPQPEVNPAEQREQALNLSRDDRRQIQTNLVALGYDTRGVDGLFGRGSRSAIAGWQSAQEFSASGFLTAGQVGLLAAQADNQRTANEAERERVQAEAEREDRAFWEATGANGRERGLRRYLEAYPSGVFAERARRELRQVAGPDTQPQAAAAWQGAQELNTIAGYQDFIDTFPQSEFVAQARTRMEQLRAEQRPQPPVAEIPGQAAEQALNLNPINRALVQIRLQGLGYQVGNISGSFDAQTRQGLTAFQRDYGLTATGYVDQATVRQLVTLAGNN
ncbi:Putative peptidoglycan binding domain-containing protein [Monaibacterium marinum]|uniref:Peptidoglycan binding domain-containing protein n=1 Tax=Pontivivens marinum TaxID=1690039 RepID=A0A2C9CS30_9RHOB|nr:peptidoglycan-binding protein [Monaibacterium marinum]SOH94028.1 Putative peptidoglycan binding domain-containing protein [Monaibacterium marinum]